MHTIVPCKCIPLAFMRINTHESKRYTASCFHALAPRPLGKRYKASCFHALARTAECHRTRLFASQTPRCPNTPCQSLTSKFKSPGSQVCPDTKGQLARCLSNIPGYGTMIYVICISSSCPQGTRSSSFSSPRSSPASALCPHPKGRR